MRRLSISAAWDEAKAIIGHDGQLLMTVALALIVLPTAVNTLINPRAVIVASMPAWMICVALICYMVALAGQLALIRLALGPSITVGRAIVHGFRRLPIYVAAVLLIVVAMFILLVIVGLLLRLAGIQLQRDIGSQMSPATVVSTLLFMLVLIFVFVRFVLSAPVASAEMAGPIAVLRRSWRLTAGHWWPLFGFLLFFFVGAGIVVIAVGSAAGVAIGFLIGKIEPMSAAALVLALINAVVSAAITTLLTVMLARIYLQLSGGGDAQAGVPSSGI
jgi:hypothetical protein